MENKLQRLLDEKIVIFDGAIGTEIYKHHFFINTSFEGLCLSHPEVIKGIHAEYRGAGAEVITTNSYAANANKLSKFGLADKMVEINRSAVALAREAAGDESLIAGSVGPVGESHFRQAPSFERKVAVIAEQAKALEDGGADFIMFETIDNLKDAKIAAAAAKDLSIPFMFSFRVDRHGEAGHGESLSSLFRAVEKSGPTALGLNCGDGAEASLTALDKAVKTTKLPVIIQPNAGIPKSVDGRMIYMTSPEYLATYAMRYVNLGARGVGGCCGTTPEHIREIANTINPLGKKDLRATMTVESKPAAEALEAIPLAERSKLGRKLANGEWISTIEITPPRGYNLDATVAKAIKCRKVGIDAINLPDGPRASSRISPLVTAQQIQERAGIETILHFCCRDKNLIGMQADLLGCAASGVNNILFITGDPPKLGDYPFASGVFDVDSIGITAAQERLNHGLDIGGQPIGEPTKAVIGVGADPNAIDMEREYRRTAEKAEAGAEFIITQPVFAVAPLLEFIEKTAYLKIPVIAGIWPLASYRNAEFMRNEVPGVTVPDEIMSRMAAADGKEAQRVEGIGIAIESVNAIRAAVAGIQVSAPFGNVDTAIAVINAGKG